MGYLWTKWEKIRSVWEKIISFNARSATKIINKQTKRWRNKCIEDE